MSKKVYEIAKELEMESKELLERINGMGIEAKSHNSTISDIDVKAITNMILHSRTKKAETKIVKAPQKTKAEAKDKEVKIAVKPATVASKIAREKPEPKTRATAKTASRKPQDSTKEQAQPSKTSPITAQPPTGIPMPKSVSVQSQVNAPPTKEEIEAARIGTPLPRSASLQDKIKKEEEQPTQTTEQAEIQESKTIKTLKTAKEDKIAKATEADKAAKATEADKIAKATEEDRTADQKIDEIGAKDKKEPVESTKTTEAMRTQKTAEDQKMIADQKTAEVQKITEAPKIAENTEVKEIKDTVKETQPMEAAISIPKGLVIKKRAADIAEEEKQRKKAQKEAAKLAEMERAEKSTTDGTSQPRAGRQKKVSEAHRPERAQDSGRTSQGKDLRRHEREQDGRRPSQGQDAHRQDRQGRSQDPSRSARPQDPSRQARSQDSSRPARQQDTQRQGRPQDSARPAREQDGSRAPRSRQETPDGISRARKTAPDTAASMKKDRDKKGKEQNFQDRAGRKDYRKRDEKLPLSMEKQAPKKYKKKVEKPVEPETNIDLETLTPGSKIINVPITVKGLSEQIEKSTSEIILALMKLGIMANVNQNLDEDTAILLGTELGINIVVDKIEEEAVEEGLEIFEDEASDLKNRPPIITVMGHVDHGKTSLLDAIRKSNVTTTESGGITQHIGASEVSVNGQRIVFLDTPGHEAFTAMRARGAHVTDIAVLVVAADDSVKPQTIESISHAKAAGVPIIVAINKVDKPEANPDRVKQDLANLPADQRVLVEEWGGDTISVPVSAKTGDGILNLLEMILLQAEVLELKANPNRLAMGTVVEARLDKAKGPVATLLVLNGTLQTGMSVVVGTCSGKIRAMTNFKGDNIRKAGPATAVEILGLNEVPEAGDEFNAVKEDKIAREIAEQRRLKVREEIMVRNSSTTLEQLFSQIKEGEVKELNLIIKADVQGSVGALISSLERLQTENVKVKIIHSGVGTITESDIMLATTSDAIIIGFNVRPSTNITTMAEHENIEIRTYRVIYDIIDDVEAAMKGMLDPVFKEVVLGKIEIRNTFKVPGVGIVGGAYVLEGKVQRNAQIRLVRDGIVIHEGKISSLRRFKDDVREVNQGYECGIGIENYNDIKEGDIIEAFKMEEIER